MNKLIIYITIILTTLTSCKSQVKKNIYSEIEGKGLIGNENFEVMKITENSTIFIGGESKWMEQSSVIMKSIDNGLSWTKIYSGKGKINQLVIVNPQSIIAVEQYFDDNRNLTSKLLSSKNGGNHWEEIDYPGQKISTISIANATDWLLYSEINSRDKLYTSKDHGVSWSENSLLNRTDILTNLQLLVYLKIFMDYTVLISTKTQQVFLDLT